MKEQTFMLIVIIWLAVIMGLALYAAIMGALTYGLVEGCTP